MTTRITPQSPYADALAYYATFGPDWDLDGADAIDGRAIAYALAFLDAVHEPHLSVHPMIHGGIQVEIHERGQDMEIEFHPDGHMEMYYERAAPHLEVEGSGVDTLVALRWWRRYWLGERED